jgi:hypothetical protein
MGAGATCALDFSGVGMKTIYLGKLGGLTISTKPNAFLGSILLWGALAAVGFFVIQLPGTQAILGGLAGMMIHILFEMIHQYGHAIAAKRAGYPMIGMRFWWILAQSIYPSDEPEIAPLVHMRRALGGPIMSLLITLIAGVVALLLASTGGLAWYLAAFAFLDSLLFFTLGALLPLGFTDGSTLIRYLGK